jgi:hypothetical protein
MTFRKLDLFPYCGVVELLGPPEMFDGDSDNLH